MSCPLGCQRARFVHDIHELILCMYSLGYLALASFGRRSGIVRRVQAIQAGLHTEVKHEIATKQGHELSYGA